MTTVFSAIVDALVPDACVGCGAGGPVLCARCTDDLQLELPRRRDPTPRPGGLPPVFAAVAYEGTARAALLAYKERGRTRLADPLARLLAAAVLAAGHATGSPAARPAPTPITIVGVPSTARSRRERGHDHVDTLAVSAVKALRALGFPAVRVRAMRRRGVARDSVALSAEERATNAGGAFVVRRSAVRRLRDTDVIVVDDIVTTGATCVAVSATLRAAGARVAAVAAVAATQRRVLVNAGE